MGKVSQTLLKFSHKHPSLLRFLLKRSVQLPIENTWVELSKIDCEPMGPCAPTLEDLEKMIDSKEFREEMWKMKKS